MLLEQWPAYLAYLAAFLNIAAIWINHHDLFTRVARVDLGLICRNLLLLGVASLFPWPASVLATGTILGDHYDQVVAAVLYAGVGLLVPLCWIVLYGYLARRPGLLSGERDVRNARAGARRSVLPVVLYPLAALIALWQPVAAVVIYVLLPLFVIVTLLVPPGRPARV